ncbi:MAG: hypothetical protein ACD_75C00557G0002 [uncultured bacterium]|nr:MAG: hypothetical protein ACD_75C00557G0002 [uncultured bacterium]
MPLVIDIFTGFEGLLGEDDILQTLQSGEQCIQAVFGIGMAEVGEQTLHLREAVVDRPQYLRLQLLDAEVVFLVEQLVHPDQQLEPSYLARLDIRLEGQEFADGLVVFQQDVLDPIDAHGLPEAFGQNELVVDEFAGAVHLAVHLLRNIGDKEGLVTSPPELKDRLYKIDDEIRTLHMSLLAQKMDQQILALMDFIQFGRNIA